MRLREGKYEEEETVKVFFTKYAKFLFGTTFFVTPENTADSNNTSNII